jgi:predicted esterase
MDTATSPLRCRFGPPLAAAALAIGLAGCGDGGDGGSAVPPVVAGVTLAADVPTAPGSVGVAPSVPAASPASLASPASPAVPAAAPVVPAVPIAAPPPTTQGPVAPPLAPIEALGPPDPGWLLRSAPVAVLTRQSIDAAVSANGLTRFAGPARCDVALHSVVHATRGPRGESTDASAAVLVPQGPGCAGPLPMLSYSRGTERDRGRTLAAPDDRETLALAAFFATRGHVVVASDYLGYAQSTYPYHPYLHAESGARVTIDALRAARALLESLGVAQTGRIVLTGYSQGGHVALATHRAIERDRPAGVAVHATGAMSGPYDLAGFASDLGSLARLIGSGGGSGAQDAVLRLGGLLGTSLLDWLARRDPLQDVLQSNSVLGWRPLAPVMLCGGARDTVVPFANTLRAAEDFASRGAPPVVVDVERVPAWQPLLPPVDAGYSELSSYHSGIVPPLCFAAVRDGLLERAP